ncbi:MAG TPA: hypothetical protein VGS41_07620 [Chthonomonadales bacterium]|nr:hypothetical protein [Chthonomonadales bacterium]
MPVLHRKAPKSAAAACAAYIDVIWLPARRTFYGAMLVIDGSGQPLEFVHNTLEAPAGFLWPKEQVQTLGLAVLCHSLFDTCRREPDILVCKDTFGTAAYGKEEISPAIPFAQAAEASGEEPASWSWINSPPSPKMATYSLSETLRTHGLATEPFARIRQGLREVYPDAGWNEAPA